MAKQRPIDELRESPIEMRIGSPENASPLRTFFHFQDGLYAVSETGIYEIRTADEIDPDRTNIGIPNSHKKIFRHGWTSKIVRQFLLTPKELLEQAYFPGEMDTTKAFDLCVQALFEAAAMIDLIEDAHEIERSASLLERVASRNENAVEIPTSGPSRFGYKAFLQHADVVADRFIDVAKIFYRGSAKNVDELLKFVSEKHGPKAEIVMFLKDVRPFLRSIREAINSAKHPDEQKSVQVSDFEMTESGGINPPQIEIFHADFPQPKIPLTAFMRGVSEAIGEWFEVMIALLCQTNAIAFGEGRLVLVELLPEQIATTGYRYRYVPNQDFKLAENSKGPPVSSK